MNFKLFFLLCTLQISLTWVIVAAEDGASAEVTSPAEVLSSAEQHETVSPTKAEDVQSDQADVKPVTQEQNDQTPPPPSPSAAAALVTEAQQQDEPSSLPTRRPSGGPTEPPPLVHGSSAEPTAAPKNGTTPQPNAPTTKDPNGKGTTLGASLVLMALGASSLRLFY